MCVGLRESLSTTLHWMNIVSGMLSVWVCCVYRVFFAGGKLPSYVSMHLLFPIPGKGLGKVITAQGAQGH